MNKIRKISIGPDYKNGSMRYTVEQSVYGGHTISDIIDRDSGYEIYIIKADERMHWKTINKNMAVVVEYDLEY